MCLGAISVAGRRGGGDMPPCGGGQTRVQAHAEALEYMPYPRGSKEGAGASACTHTRPLGIQRLRMTLAMVVAVAPTCPARTYGCTGNRIASLPKVVTPTKTATTTSTITTDAPTAAHTTLALPPARWLAVAVATVAPAGVPCLPPAPVQSLKLLEERCMRPHRPQGRRALHDGRGGAQRPGLHGKRAILWVGWSKGQYIGLRVIKFKLAVSRLTQS